MQDFSSQARLNDAIQRNQPEVGNATSKLNSGIARNQSSLNAAMAKITDGIARNAPDINQATAKLNNGIARNQAAIGGLIPATKSEEKAARLPEQRQVKAASLGERSVSKQAMLTNKQAARPFQALAPRALDSDSLTGNSTVDQFADVPLGLAKNAVMGVRMITDAFGASNETSDMLQGYEEEIGKLMSAQYNKDAQEMERIRTEAIGKGSWEGVKAGIHALSVAPIDTIIGALGTAAPAIIAGAAVTLGAPVVGLGVAATATVGSAVALGTGALMGAGVTKSAIYEATADAFKEQGVPKEEAEAIATEAQEYGGENTDSILTGAALGYIATRFGIDPKLVSGASKLVASKLAAKEAAEKIAKKIAEEGTKKGALKKLAKDAVEEGIPEAFQGGHEVFAGNLAKQREGIDTDLSEGVAFGATLEGFAGGGVGVGGGGIGLTARTAVDGVKGTINAGKKTVKGVKKAKAQIFGEDKSGKKGTFQQIKEGVIDIANTAADFVAEGKAAVKDAVKVEAEVKSDRSVEEAIQEDNKDLTAREKVDVATHKSVRPGKDASPAEVLTFRDNAMNALLQYYTELKDSRDALISDPDAATVDPDQKKAYKFQEGMNVILARMNELGAVIQEEGTEATQFNTILDSIKEHKEVPSEIALMLGTTGGQGLTTEELKKAQLELPFDADQTATVENQIAINDTVSKAYKTNAETNKDNKRAEEVSLEIIDGSSKNAGFKTYHQRIVIGVKTGSLVVANKAYEGLQSFVKLQQTKLAAFQEVSNLGDKLANDIGNKAVRKQYNAAKAALKKNHKFTFLHKGGLVKTMALIQAEVTAGQAIAKQAKHILKTGAKVGSTSQSGGAAVVNDTVPAELRELVDGQKKTFAALGSTKAKLKKLLAKAEKAFEKDKESLDNKVNVLALKEMLGIIKVSEKSTDNDTVPPTANLETQYSDAVTVLLALTAEQKKHIVDKDGSRILKGTWEGIYEFIEAQSKTDVKQEDSMQSIVDFVKDDLPGLLKSFQKSKGDEATVIKEADAVNPPVEPGGETSPAVALRTMVKLRRDITKLVQIKKKTPEQQSALNANFVEHRARYKRAEKYLKTIKITPIIQGLMDKITEASDAKKSDFASKSNLMARIEGDTLYQKWLKGNPTPTVNSKKTNTENKFKKKYKGKPKKELTLLETLKKKFQVKSGVAKRKLAVASFKLSAANIYVGRAQNSILMKIIEGELDSGNNGVAYDSDDVVFVGTDTGKGANSPISNEKFTGVYKELDLAMEAGASIITDWNGITPAEIAVAAILTKNGYTAEQVVDPTTVKDNLTPISYSKWTKTEEIITNKQESLKNESFNLTESILEEGGKDFDVPADSPVKSRGTALGNLFNKRPKSDTKLFSNVLHTVRNWATRVEGNVEKLNPQLNKKELKMVENFLEFNKKMTDIYTIETVQDGKTVLPLLEPFKDEQQREFKRGNVIQLFYTEKADSLIGKDKPSIDLMDPNVITQLNAVLYRWMGTFGKGTLRSTKSDVQQIFGIRKSKLTPTDEMYDLVGEEGTSFITTAENLGMDALASLGLSPKESTGETFESKTAQALGALMLNAGLQSNLLEMNSVARKDISDLTARFNKAIGIDTNDETSDLTLAAVPDPKFAGIGIRRFIRVASQFKKIGETEADSDTEVVSSAVQGYIDNYKLGSDAFSNLFGLSKSAKAPSLKPPFMQNIARTLGNSGLPVPNYIREILYKHSQQKHQLNDTHRAFMKFPLNMQFRMLGGIENLSNLHVSRRMAVRAQNEEIRRFLDGMNTFVTTLEENPNKLNTEFFFTHDVWVNARVGIKETIMNPQANKAARAMVSVSDAETEMDLTSTAAKDVSNVQVFLLGIAEVLGVNTKQSNDADVIQELHDVTKSKELKTALAILKDNYRNPNRAMSIKQLDAVSTSITKLGKGAAGLSGLVAYAQYEATQEDIAAKVANAGKFITSLSIEIDGRNNGVAHANIQLGYNESGETEGGTRTKVMNQTGLYEPGSDFKSANDFLSSPANLDVYEDVATKVQKEVTNTLSVALAKSNTEAISGGESTTEQRKYAELLAVSGLVESFVKDSLSKESEEEVGTVSKGDREDTKDTVIQFVYGAGVKSRTASFLNKAINAVYKKIEDTSIIKNGKVTGAKNSELGVIINHLRALSGDPDLTIPTDGAKHLDFMFSTKLELVFLQRVKELYGKNINTALTSNFNQIIKERKKVTQLHEAIGEMFLAAYQTELMELRIKKGTNVTKGDIKGIIDKLDKAGLLPKMTTAISGRRDSVKDRTGAMLWSLQKAAYRDSNDLYKKEVASLRAQNTTQSLIDASILEDVAKKLIRSKDNVQFYRNGAGSINNTSSINDGTIKQGENVKQFSLNPKHTSYEARSHKALVFLIHSIDSFNMYEMYDTPVPMIGVHDAIMLGVKDVHAGTKVANDSFWRSNKNFNIKKAALEDYNLTLESFKEYQESKGTSTPILNDPELIDRVDTKVANMLNKTKYKWAMNNSIDNLAHEIELFEENGGISNQFGNGKVEVDESEDLGSPTSASIDNADSEEIATIARESEEEAIKLSADIHWQAALSHGIIAGFDANNELSILQEPDNEVGKTWLASGENKQLLFDAVELVDMNDQMKLMFKTVLGSAPNTTIDPNKFLATESWTITGEDTLSLFDTLGDVNYGNKSENSAHQTYMRKLLIDLGVSKAIDGMKVRLKKAGDETEGKYIIRKDGSQEILIQSASAASVNGIRMSTQETYTHEILHAISQAAINGSSDAARFLQGLFDEVRGNSELDFRMFLNDYNDTTNLQEVNEAKRRYNYIFNNTASRIVSHRDVYTTEPHTHKRNDHLHEFFALGLSNENFMTALSKVKSKKKVKGKDRTFFDKFIDLLTVFVGLFNKQFVDAKNLDMSQQLRFVAQKFAEIEGGAKNKISLANKAFTFANDEVIARSVNFITKGVKGAADSKFIVENKYKTVRTVGGIVSKFKFSNWDRYTEVIAGVRRRMGVSAEGLLSSLYREIRGVTPDARFWHQLLSYSNKKLDQQHKAIDNFTREDVLTAYKTKFSDSVSESLTKTLVRTDISVLDADYSMKEMEGFMEEDSKKLFAEVDSIEDFIKANYDPEVSNWYLAHSESLANLMVKGRMTQVDTLGNAHNIAMMYESGFNRKVKHPEGGFDKTSALLDNLITLRALIKTPKSHKKATLDVMKTENYRDETAGGIFFTIQLLKENKKQSLDQLFEGKKEMVRKGFSKEIYNENISMQFGSIADEEEMMKDGFLKVSDSNLKLDAAHKGMDGLVMYVNKNSQNTAYQRSIIAINQERFIGNDLTGISQQRGVGDPAKAAQIQFNQLRAIKRRQRQAILDGTSVPIDTAENNLVVPINREDGTISGYRYVMEESTKDAILERDNSLEKVLGKMEAGISDKVAARSINNTVVKTLYTEFKETFSTADKGHFVKIGPNSTNKHHREIYRMLPQPMRRQIKDVFGTDHLYVRGEIVDLVFGRRKFSITDIGKTNDTSVERGIFGNTAQLLLNRPMMRSLENFVQDVYKIVKDIIVIKSFVVLRDNILSNTAMLMMRGVSFRQILADYKEASLALKDYKKYTRERLKLEKKIKTLGQSKSSNRILALPTQRAKDAAIAVIDRSIASIEGDLTIVEERLATNAVTELSEAGVQQTIVEDVVLEDSKSNLKSNLEKRLAPAAAYVPDVFKTIGKNIFVTQDTGLYKALRDVTQISDFVARYSLHQHNLKNGVSSKDSIGDVVESFINYDPLTHKYIQWMNDMGFWMFTKFFIRIQSILVKLMVGRQDSKGRSIKGNPAGILAFLAVNMLTIDVPTVYDASLIGEDSIENRFHWNIAGNAWDQAFGGVVTSSIPEFISSQ